MRALLFGTPDLRSGVRTRCQLQGNDVLGLWAFLTVGYGELDFLAFSQSFEARTLDSAEVRKYVWAIFLLDKAKTFGFVEPLYSAGYGVRHNRLPIFLSCVMPWDVYAQLALWQEMLLVLITGRDTTVNFETQK